jgi:mannose-1-phosphate guanylyltransferase
VIPQIVLGNPPDTRSAVPQARHHFIRPKGIQRAVKAVLLVGGMGTRLRPLTYRLPKPLIPVMGKPLMMHVIDRLPDEVDELIIPVSYKKEMMQDYLSRNPPPKKVTLVDEPEALGTGGAVKNVESLLEEGTFLVINGDSIWSLDVGEFIGFHRRKKAIATISLWPVEDITGYGVVDLDPDQRIRRFQEKPKKEEAFSNMINAGVYALEHEVLDYIGKGFVSMEREVFPMILDEGMYGYRFDGYWVDCGKRENLLDAFWTLMGDTKSVDRDSVHEGADVRRPAVVREAAVVAGAVIGPRAYVSERAVVGIRSRVEGSVILEDARIGTRCSIVDSIVDAGVTVPDGTEVQSTILSNAKEPAKK